MSWGIAVLLLSLLNSRGKKANFQKLQFLAHAVRVSEGREDLCEGCLVDNFVRQEFLLGSSLGSIERSHLLIR